MFCSVLSNVCIPVVPIQFVMLIPDNDKRRTDFNAYPECCVCKNECAETQVDLLGQISLRRMCDCFGSHARSNEISVYKERHPRHNKSL